MVDHDLVIFGLNFVKAREGVPVDLAVVGLRTTWAWALVSLVERAEIGVDTQFTYLMQPQATDTASEFLFAVIAIGLLSTFGNETGIDHQSLFMVRRHDMDDRRLVERAKVKVCGLPARKGPLVIRAVAAQIPRSIVK